MKTSLKDLLKETFEGKILISSEFVKESDKTLYDAWGNKLSFDDFNPFGKVIKEARLGLNQSREDAGLFLIFDGWTEPFFFYANDNLVIK